MDQNLKKRLLKEESSLMERIRLQLMSELFHRYLNGEATEREKKIVERFDMESYWGKCITKSDDKLIDEGCEEVWKLVMAQILWEEQESEKNKVKRILPMRIISRFAAIAAMVAILFYGGYIALNSKKEIYTTENRAMAQMAFQTNGDEVKEFVLPDGSVIHLNRGSKLSYDKKSFDKTKRDVWLEEGEAFFEVTRNVKKPFTVHSGGLATIVKGTSFNIKAYRELGENVVSVRSGRVEVTDCDKKIIGVLTKDRQLTYNITKNSYETNDMDWENAAGWMEGKLMLCNANTKELQLRIRQYFGLELDVRNHALDGVLFNSSFNKGVGLKDVLERISVLYSVNYEIKENRVIIN